MATSMQSILDQLAGYGFDTSGGIGDWSNQDIATTMGTYFGQTPFSGEPGDTDYEGMSDDDVQQAFLPQMFTQLSPELIKASSIKNYSPMIQSSQSSLLSELLSKTSGKTARRATGGFAGSGAFNKYKQGVKDVYGRGMGTELSKAFSSKGQSLQSIQDLISQWAEHAQEVAPAPWEEE